MLSQKQDARVKNQIKHLTASLICKYQSNIARQHLMKNKYCVDVDHNSGAAAPFNFLHALFN